MIQTNLTPLFCTAFQSIFALVLRDVDALDRIVVRLGQIGVEFGRLDGAAAAAAAAGQQRGRTGRRAKRVKRLQRMEASESGMT